MCLLTGAGSGEWNYLCLMNISLCQPMSIRKCKRTNHNLSASSPGHSCRRSVQSEQASTVDLRVGRQVPPLSPWQVSHENPIRVMINKGRMAPLFLGGDRGLLIWVDTDTDVTGKGLDMERHRCSKWIPRSCRHVNVNVRFKICKVWRGLHCKINSVSQ